MAYYPPHNQLPQEPPANMSYNQQWQPVEHSGPPASLPAVCQFTMLCVKCAHQTVYHLIPVAAGQPALQNSAAAGQLLLPMNHQNPAGAGHPAPSNYHQNPAGAGHPAPSNYHQNAAGAGQSALQMNQPNDAAAGHPAPSNYYQNPAGAGHPAPSNYQQNSAAAGQSALQMNQQNDAAGQGDQPLEPQDWDEYSLTRPDTWVDWFAAMENLPQQDLLKYFELASAAASRVPAPVPEEQHQELLTFHEPSNNSAAADGPPEQRPTLAG